MQACVQFAEDSHDDVELLQTHLRSAGITPQWLRVCGARNLRVALISSEWQVALAGYGLRGFGGLRALRTLADAVSAHATKNVGTHMPTVGWPTGRARGTVPARRPRRRYSH